MFKTSLLEKTKDLSDSSSVVLQLAKSLPKSYSHVVYMNNFFTNVKLYTALKELGIEAYRTVKNESEFTPELLTFQEVLIKKNNWKIKAYFTVEEVLYLAWQDNNTVQLMTTIHTLNDLKAYNILFKDKQHEISIDTRIIYEHSVYRNSLDVRS